MQEQEENNMEIYIFSVLSSPSSTEELWKKGSLFESFETLSQKTEKPRQCHHFLDLLSWFSFASNL